MQSSKEIFESAPVGHAIGEKVRPVHTEVHQGQNEIFESVGLYVADSYDTFKSAKIDKKTQDLVQKEDRFNNKFSFSKDGSPQIMGLNSRLNGFETPIEKLNRLKAEVQETESLLISIVERNDKGAKPKKDVIDDLTKYVGADPAEMLAQLSHLKNQIEGIFGDSNLQQVMATGSLPKENESTLESMEYRLGNALKRIQNKKAPSQFMTDPKKVSYELFSLPSQGCNIERRRLFEIENRIANLEGVLGISEGKELSMPYPDVMTGIQSITERLLLADPSRLQSISDKLQSVGNEIDSIVKKHKGHEVVAQADKYRHIQEVYDTCEKWRKSAAALPVIVKRLRMLKTLHFEGMSASARLEAIEDQQKSLSDLVSSTSDSYASLEKAVLENLSTLKELVENKKMKK